MKIVSLLEYPLIKDVEEISGHYDKLVNPVVSILILTFNQASYIQQCIDSILSQQTSFKFEIVIGEDDSTDGTREICKKIAYENPDIIRLLLHSDLNKIRNIEGHPTGKFNLLYSIQKCRGKYIAFCEGDDFWNDNNKLQKQVDFLEQNTDYVGVFTDFDKLIEQTGKITINFNSFTKKINENKDVSISHLFSRDIKYLRTLTSMFHTKVLKEFKFYYLFSAGDSQWIFHALQYGKIRYLNYSTGVYRVLNESASHSVSFKKKQLFLENYINFLKTIQSQLNYRERRYIKKITLIAKLRKYAYAKKFLRLLFISFQLLISLHFSRNIFRTIRFAFRR